jgi:hypothetical protein
MNRLGLFCLFSLVLLISFAAASVTAQSSHRDYMTDAEIELVRDAQDIDLRVDVLIKMVDRRFAVLKMNVGGAAIPSKEADKWGTAPTGSQIEILDDIRKLLEKAIDDIDNVATHPVNYDVAGARSEKQKKKDSLRFPDSVRNLASAVKRYQPALKTLLDQSKDEREKGLILGALESCDEILAATSKVSGETKDN